MTLPDAALDQLFRTARTYRAWQDQNVADDMLRAIYDLMKWGPTSANSSPARVVFVKSRDAKERLRPCLDAGNVDQTMEAPVTAIIGHDLEFYENLPTLTPHTDARSWFAGKAELIQVTAFRNGSLQGAYLIIAARALGLDCGPMSGFDRTKVDRAFFSANSWKSNFLINLGYPKDEELPPRLPRLTYEQAVLVA